MRVPLRFAGAMTVACLVAACASAAPAPAPSSVARPTGGREASAAPTTAPPTTPTDAPTAAGAAGATPAASASASGALILTSKMYPYELDVPGGPVVFVDASTRWDGSQNLSSDSRTTDHVRVPGTGMMRIVMTETTKDVGAFADEMEAKFRGWHGCTTTSPRRSFKAGEADGIAFAQSCAGGAMKWIRAVLVGEGAGLVMYSDGGTIDTATAALSGVRFVGP